MQPQPTQPQQNGSARPTSNQPPPPPPPVVNEPDARMPPPRGAAAAPAGYYPRFYPATAAAAAAAMPQLTYMEGQLTTQAMLVEQQRRIKQLEADLYATRAEVQRLQADARARESAGGAPADNTNNGGEKKTSSRYWTPDEHKRFLEGLELFGPRDIKAIARHVGTRSATQVRTHSQKYYIRLERERAKAEAAAAAVAAAANGVPPPTPNSQPTDRGNAASPTSPKKSRARPRSRTAAASAANKAASPVSVNGKNNDKSATNQQSPGGNATQVKREMTVIESPTKSDRKKRSQPDPDIGATKRRTSSRRVKPKNNEEDDDDGDRKGGDKNKTTPNGAPSQANPISGDAATAKSEPIPEGGAGGLLSVPNMSALPTGDVLVPQTLPNVPSSVALGTLPNVPGSVSMGTLPNVPGSVSLGTIPNVSSSGALGTLPNVSSSGALASLPNVSSSGALLAPSLPTTSGALVNVASSGQLSSLAHVPSVGTLPRVSSTTGLPMVPSTGALPRVGSSGGLVLPRVASSLTAAWNAQTAMDRAALAKLRPGDGGTGPTPSSSTGVAASAGVTTGSVQRSGNTGFPRTNSILSLLSGLPTAGLPSVASSDRLNAMPFDTMEMDEAALDAKWAAES